MMDDMSNDHNRVNHCNDHSEQTTTTTTTTTATTNQKPITVTKQHKRGIIYLSYIPDGLSVNKLRQILTEFGEIDRIYLEPKRSHTQSRKKKAKSMNSAYGIGYVEGWVEFKKRRVAKTVALMLNGRQIGGKRKNKFRDSIWSIKYLPKFEWTHLAEHMNYEKQLRDQRLRFEISRAKQETNFYSSLIERSIVQNKRLNKLKGGERSDDNNHQTSAYKRRENDQTIKPHENNTGDQIDMSLLNQIFN